MHIALPRTPARPRIEIIPLIDVVFFLMAAFVLFTLSLNKIGTIPVDLPRSVPHSGPATPPTVLTITAAETLCWDGAPIHPGELPARLALLKESTPQPRVLIAGDRFASYGLAIRTLDQVRAADIATVSIETRVRPQAH